MTMPGLMQDWPLTVDRIIDHAEDRIILADLTFLPALAKRAAMPTVEHIVVLTDRDHHLSFRFFLDNQSYHVAIAAAGHQESTTTGTGRS